MPDELASFRALPYETKRAILDRLIARFERSLAEARRELLGEQTGNLRCDRCRYPTSYTIDGLCAFCRPPVPIEVAGNEWEERE